MMIDVVMINAAVYFSLYFRFDTIRIPAIYLNPYYHAIPLFSGLTIVLFWVMRLYHRLWQYASSRDAQVLIGGVIGSSLFLGGAEVLNGASHYPRAAYLLYVLFAITLVGGWRFLIHAFYDFHWTPRLADAPRVLIIGAGKAGQLVAQELLRHKDVGVAVGFLDDDRYKRGMQMGSLKVLGGTDSLASIIRELHVDQVLFAMPSASGKILQPLVEQCRDIGITAKTLPAINQMIGSPVSFEEIRDVQIEDLLQREPTAVDLGQIAGYLTGRNVLITGAGGTIGSQLARQIVAFAPSRVILLGMDETSIFEVDRELREKYPHIETVPVVADIRDVRRIEHIFETERPNIVFHAAAHKHVPLMEGQPDEAIANNVMATWQLIDLSHRCQIDSFVFISTDKAVNPTSIYGATKRMGEILVGIYAQASKTRFVSVRFGNVLGSRGSVIPTFQRQIAQGGPITITHPDMVRYFMTVSEASQLVVQAGAMARGGEVFVLDMGDPVRILDIATNLVRLSGLRAGIDIEFVFTGMRPGEKLYEEVLTQDDQTRATRHDRIFVHKDRVVDAHKDLQWIEKLVREGRSMDRLQLMRLIKIIVPEYQPQRELSTVIGVEGGTGRGIRTVSGDAL